MLGAAPLVAAILQTASGLGIRYDRGGQYFRCDYTRNLWQQLQELKPRVATLAALDEKYRTAVCYHTHSGAGNIGGNIWVFPQLRHRPPNGTQCQRLDRCRAHCHALHPVACDQGRALGARRQGGGAKRILSGGRRHDRSEAHVRASQSSAVHGTDQCAPRAQ
jgi:hypothetical protein